MMGLEIFLAWTIYLLVTVDNVVCRSTKNVEKNELIENYKKQERPQTLQQNGYELDAGRIAIDTETNITNFGFTKSRVRRGAHPESMRETIVPLPSSITSAINEYLKESHFSYEKKVGGMIEFSCRNKAVTKFLSEYPRSARGWVHNNHALKIEGDRMVYQLGTLLIQSLKVEDQGVYLCRMEYEPGQFKTVALYSLIVETSDIGARVKRSLALSLQSNSAPIGFLIPGMTREWQKDGVVMKSGISARGSLEDTFPDSDESFAGYWLCLVSKNGTGKPWKTARYRVKVDKPPSIKERFVKFCSTNPILITSLILGLVAFGVVMGMGMIQKAAKDKLNEEKEFDLIKSRLLGNENGVTGGVESTSKEQEKIVVVDDFSEYDYYDSSDS